MRRGGVTRPILFLSDYGRADVFVGVCHAAIERVAPGARVIDVTHDVPPHDVLRGAIALADAVRYAPRDAVALAVVDPGVGTDRRAVAVRAAGMLLVGPDNGLLSPAWDALGEAEHAVEIRVGDLAAVAPTFHGRDVFAPAAARLAAGGELGDEGPEIDVHTLIRVATPEVRTGDRHVECRVVAVDRFGNVQLFLRRDDLRRAGLDDALRVELECWGGTFSADRVRTFADLGGGRYGLLEDSFGWIAVVRDRASAARALGVGAGDPVTIRAPDAR